MPCIVDRWSLRHPIRGKVGLERKNIIISTQVINKFIWIMNRKYAVPLAQLEVLADKFWQKFEVALIKKLSIKKALSVCKTISILTGTV